MTNNTILYVKIKKKFEVSKFFTSYATKQILQAVLTSGKWELPYLNN
jgi:hypothetical protein